MKRSAYDLNHEEWLRYMEKTGNPSFRANQVMDWLYNKRVCDFASMSNLSKSLRESLENDFILSPLEVEVKQVAKDNTIKFLFKLPDGNAIETVVIRHNYGNSICVTTQVGCRIGCTFCASTIGGLKRNLTAGEIVSQVIEAQRVLDKEDQRIKSIVVMGSGEPFDNYENTIKFVRLMIDPKTLNIGQRHITVSTSGIIPKIYAFADEHWQVKLAISLHATTDASRSKLMPINRKYKLPELIEACQYYTQATKRRLSFEYALIQGENDSDEEAHKLADLIKGVDSLVNLIPINNVVEKSYKRTSKNRLFSFKNVLESRGVTTTIRREYGHDIDAACGQLRAKHAETNTK